MIDLNNEQIKIYILENAGELGITIAKAVADGHKDVHEIVEIVDTNMTKVRKTLYLLYTLGVLNYESYKRAVEKRTPAALLSSLSHCGVRFSRLYC